MKIFKVADRGLVYVNPAEFRWADLGDDGEFEIYELTVDEERWPAGFVVATGRWFRPDGTIVPGRLEFSLADPEVEAKKVEDLTALDLLTAGWETWTVEADIDPFAKCSL